MQTVHFLGLQAEPYPKRSMFLARVAAGNVEQRDKPDSSIRHPKLGETAFRRMQLRYDLTPIVFCQATTVCADQFEGMHSRRTWSA